MKILYQTATPYGYDPAFDAFGETLYEQCRRAARPGTEITIVGCPHMAAGFDVFKHVQYFHKIQIFKEMLKAEKKGYDAFVIGSSMDDGLREGREMLSIPVVGVTQTSLSMANMLGERYTMVSLNPTQSEAYRQRANSYGLATRYMPGDYHMGMSGEQAFKMHSDPHTFAALFTELARKAVAEGASVIIPGTVLITAWLHLANAFDSLDGVLVMDTISVAIKNAEMLVDLKRLGVEVSRKAQIYPSPGPQALAETLKKYEKVFHLRDEGGAS